MPHLTTFMDDSFRFELDVADQDKTRISCVIGPNGSGKSQLLRAIVDAVERKVPSGASTTAIARTRQLSDFSQVLAISNLVADVFPSTRRLDRYRYLGVRQATNWTGTRAVESLTVDSVLLCLRSPARVDAFRAALGIIGFSDFGVAADPEVKVPRGRPRTGAATSTKEIQPIDQFGEHFLPVVRDGRAQLATGDIDAWQRVMSDLDDGVRMFGVEPSDGIAFLRKRGELTATLHFSQSGRTDDVGDLSAGQLLIVSLAARLAAHVAADSLVLIDEPEIGLHPTWQALVAPLLREIVPPELKSHVIVATHSPHVVVDADDVLVSGATWGKFETFDESVGGRSVENILYRVFEARVVGNTEVEDDLTLVTSFLAGLSDTDLVEVRRASDRLRDVASSDTPVVNQVLEDVEQALAGNT